MDKLHNQYEINKLLHQYKYGVITLIMLIEFMMPYCDHEIKLVCEFLATVLDGWDTDELLFFWENN